MKDNQRLESVNKMIRKLEGNEEVKEILSNLMLHIENMTDEIQELKEKLQDTLEYAEFLEQDMDNIKEEIFGEEIVPSQEDDEEFIYVEVKCSKCGENIYVEDDLMKEHLHCPNCDNKLF